MQQVVKMQKAYSTWDSQAVSDPSTNQARRCLTWQIGRDAVLSTWYGRKRKGVMLRPFSDGKNQTCLEV